MTTVQRKQWPPLVRSALLVLCTLFIPSTARADAPRLVEKQVQEEINTVHGKLEIHRSEFEDSSSQYQFTLDGKIVTTLPVNQMMSLEARYPEKGPVRVVLVNLPTGGSGCPAFFQILEVKDDGGTALSKKFGNCSDNVRTSFTNGVLRVDISKIGGAKAETWLYQNGKLTQAARAARK